VPFPTLRSLLARLPAVIAGTRPARTPVPAAQRPPSPPERAALGLRRTALGNGAFGMTDIGNLRVNNEDDMHISADGRLLVVADGMGGHEGGEVASAIACSTLAAAYHAGPIAEPEKFLLQAIDDAHRSIQEASATKAGERPMGTAMVAALLCEDGTAVIAHVGDARAYVAEVAQVIPMTHDHSVIAELLRSKRILPEQVRRHPLRNRLTQAVGLPAPIRPGIERIEPGQGNFLILCSDGLWECFDDALWRQAISSAIDARSMSQGLVDAAIAAGGSDNVTAVVAGPF